MPGFTDHVRSPRTPLTPTALHDLAAFLKAGTPGAVEYADLAQLVAHGPHFAIDPAGIAAARKRLSDAAERGNATAAGLLAEIAAITEPAP